MSIEVFRHSGYDTPWWANPNSKPGRFHRANEAPTQYLCAHPLGPAAEMLRHHLGPGGIGDLDTVRLNLWAARVDPLGLVVIDFSDCASHGISPDDLVGDKSYAKTQALADAVSSAGAPGIAYHSAALPGTMNVVLFGSRILHPYGWKPVIPDEVPTGHLTDAGRPPPEVATAVRWLGTPHTALDEWKATGTYTPFDDPRPGA